MGVNDKVAVVKDRFKTGTSILEGLKGQIVRINPYSSQKYQVKLENLICLDFYEDELELICVS